MASANSYQRKTKGNRPLKTNGLPSYSISVENRIKRIKAEMLKPKIVKNTDMSLKYSRFYH